MSNKTREVKLGLDPNIKKVKNGNLTVWSHDKNSFEIKLYLDDGCGNPLVLTDGKLRIMLIPENSPIQIFDLNTDSERLGEASFIIPVRLLGFVGDVKATVYVDYEDKTHDLGSFNFNMKRSDIDKNMPELTFYVESMDEALKKADELEEKIKRNDLVTKPELNEVEKNKVNNSSFDKLSVEVSTKADKTTVNKQVSDLEKEVDTKATKQETDNKLEKKTNNDTFVAITSDMQRQIESTQSGMLGEFDSEDELKKAYPDGAKGYAVVWFMENNQATGYTYTFKNKKWTKGQVWNGMGIPDLSITPIKTTFIDQTNNLFNWKTVSRGYYINSDGELISEDNYVVSDYIEVDRDTVYSRSNDVVNVSRYDRNRNFMGLDSTIPFNTLRASYVRLTIRRKDYIKSQFNKGEKLLPFESGENNLSKSVTVTNDNLSLKKNEIDFDVKTKIGFHASMIITGEKPLIDTNKRELTIFSGTYFLIGSRSFLINSNQVFKLQSQHHYLYFDINSKSIKVLSSISSLEKISESNVYFGYISFLGSESKEIDIVDLPVDHMLDNELTKKVSNSEIDKLIQKHNNNNNNLFSEIIPNQNYVPVTDIEDFSAENHYVDLITETEIYSKYDAAVSNGWGTKTLLGNDSSDTHPIYKYEFKPEIVPAEKYKKHFPKIILTTCTHGEEKMGAISLANFIKDISDNYESNDLLRFVKNNVHLIIIPILNSFGFNNFKRKNANGVDINRNSSYRWATSASSDPSSIQFKGTAPFSEKENQYVRDLILENKDATAFFDYHMNGTSGGDGDYIHNFWHYIEDREKERGFDELNELSIRNIMLMTERSHEAYGINKNSGWVGMINYNGRDSSLAAYAYSEGIPGFTIECLKKLQGETVVYSKKSIAISTEFIGNHIINVCRSFTNN